MLLGFDPSTAIGVLPWIARSMPASAAERAFWDSASSVEVLTLVIVLDAIDNPIVEKPIIIRTTTRRT